jgi:hypothetical protein
LKRLFTALTIRIYEHALVWRGRDRHAGLHPVRAMPGPVVVVSAPPPRSRSTSEPSQDSTDFGDVGPDSEHSRSPGANAPRSSVTSRNCTARSGRQGDTSGHQSSSADTTHPGSGRRDHDQQRDKGTHALGGPGRADLGTSGWACRCGWGYPRPPSGRRRRLTRVALPNWSLKESSGRLPRRVPAQHRAATADWRLQQHPPRTRKHELGTETGVELGPVLGERGTP